MTTVPVGPVTGGEVGQDRPAIRIMISLELSAELTVDELWPDGDAPEEITEEAVKALIKHCGGPNEILNDWALGRLNYYVRVRRD